MSKIKLPHASGNSMSIAAPATNPASDLELKLPATIGSADQYMKVDGSGNLGWVTPPTSGNVTRAVANASHSTGSGTVEFTSLPSTAYWHRVTIYNISTTNNVEIYWQLGTSSAYKTSNYKTSCGYLAGGASTAVDGDTAWMRTDGATAGSNNKCMTVDFNRAQGAGGTGHNWICRAYTTESGYNYWYWTAAEIDMGAALEKIKFYVASGSFDNGLFTMESFT